jgi:hypothetical protein
LGAQQVIGIALAFAIVILQIRSGVIPQHLTPEALASIAWPYAALTGLLIVIAIVKAPVKLDMERAIEASSRDEQIASLQRNIASHSSEEFETRFRFHLKANPSARTDIKMRYLDTFLMIGVSTVELVVTNGGLRPFNLLACRWFRESVPVHRPVSPHAPVRVNLTEEIIMALVGNDFNSVPSVSQTHTLHVAIDCQAEDGEPISTETQSFQIEITRVSRALNVKIRKAQ